MLWMCSRYGLHPSVTAARSTVAWVESSTLSPCWSTTCPSARLKCSISLHTNPTPNPNPTLVSITCCCTGANRWAEPALAPP
eukprot:7665089-Pyramimonas_sp.AAC.1